MLNLYNALTRKVEPFTPIDSRNVRIYSCGPTVYDHTHIGNLSSYIFADTLRRTLAASDYNVTQVMNYTDIDDKTIQRSQKKYPELEPRAALEKLTVHYSSLFLEDMKKIGNNINALTFVRATDHIEAMKQLVMTLHEKGFAYITDDGIYFSIDAYKKSGKVYGQLLEINTKNTSRARIANDEYDKESVHDWALWKISKKNEPAWQFQLDGKVVTGRPGWHIECSSLARQIIGQPFDIHTGGVDLIFPHHENEIAQSTAGEENPTMATVFTHNEHLMVDGKKMAKSAHNFFTLDNIIQKDFNPLAFRLMILQSHYRSQNNFTWESLEAAQNRLRSYQAFADLRFQPIKSGNDQVTEADYVEHGQIILSKMKDDLLTPEALKQFDFLADERHESIPSGEINQFHSFLEFIDKLLGLQLLQSQNINSAQNKLITEREKARQEKDWSTSDKLREVLRKQGINLRDTKHGPIWSRQNMI